MPSLNNIYDTMVANANNIYAEGEGGGGGSLTAETPVGAINNSNVTFTVGHTPVFLFVNGVGYSAGHGYSYSGGIITLDAPVGTGGSIISYHN